MQDTNGNTARKENPSRMVNPADHPVLFDLHGRVTKLELRESEMVTELAVLKTDMNYLKENVGAIRGGVNKVLWAIGISVLLAATTFVLSGGLVVVQR